MPEQSEGLGMILLTTVDDGIRVDRADRLVWIHEEMWDHLARNDHHASLIVGDTWTIYATNGRFQYERVSGPEELPELYAGGLAPQRMGYLVRRVDDAQPS